ncbi:membrane protein [Nocardioides szechwanensis]|uniref:Putative drug exporter of the RND superfamily n=1 Tax=Nocardioides szechwanensis TaxID=1005944 RepID=A0A1H0A3G7_9ACTN|nr:MMPL family transporter [Nocardioides szechwanensis]GEP36093.1 membrane protein [Nocardioides szechwanensis]SDN28352.1 putative drug exporter of the RND superfamily [Nocardioides szechwanensis]
MNRFSRSIGTASARHPSRTIVGWVALLLAVVFLAAGGGGSFVDDFVAPGSESGRALEQLEEDFPEAAQGSALVVFASEDGQPLAAHRRAIDAVMVEVALAQHVEGFGDPLRVGTVSADGRVGFVELTLDAPGVDLGKGSLADLTDVVETSDVPGLRVELGGDAVFLNAPDESSPSEGIGILVALLVLLVAFGTIVAALVPIALALVSVGAGIGGILLLAGSMNVSVSAVPVAGVVGLGVGIDYALFIVARYRENREAGQDNERALAGAMGSSGAAVIFAGGTVAVAMSALALTGLGLLTSIGLATAIVVLAAVAAALTLLPALLALLGDRIDTGRVLRHRPAARPSDSAWWRFGHRVAGRPWPYLLGATVALLALAAPALWIQTAFPAAGDAPSGTTYRQAYDLLEEGFGPGVNGPLLLVVDLEAPGAGAADLTTLTEAVAANAHIASVSAVRTSADGGTAVLTAMPTTGPADLETSVAIAEVRDLLPGNVRVSGITATTDDLTTQLSDTMPLFVGAVLVASFLLLMLVFRSVVVPLKAAVMNLLSIGGAYGVLVVVFQWGWGSSLIGLEGPTPITSLILVIMFPILFGLSMDYEVFLLSRVREEYVRTGDNTESVARGLAGTGRVITSAALIMVAVFLAFVASPVPSLKMLGLGLATAVLIDATVVRMILVPATMALLGRANWWLPAWLDRVLPRLTVEGEASPLEEPDHVAVGVEVDPAGVGVLR